MVDGLDYFKEYFSPYIDQYVLIGGVACSLLMEEAGLDFRANQGKGLYRLEKSKKVWGKHR
jgi:hypothetical protein